MSYEAWCERTRKQLEKEKVAAQIKQDNKRAMAIAEEHAEAYRENIYKDLAK